MLIVLYFLHNQKESKEINFFSHYPELLSSERIIRNVVRKENAVEMYCKII